MKYKKIVSGLLACAMVVTSAFAGTVASVKAEGEQPAPVASYNFNATDAAPDQGTLGQGVVLKSSPNNAAGSPELNDYTEAVKYVPGRSGEAGDYAVDTEGKHGFVLPDKQLGENYTVSFWVKPTDISKGRWATSLLFVGRSEVTAEAQWVSMATANNTGAIVCWSLGNNQGGGGISVKQDEWQMLTMVQSGTNAKFYLNGEKKVEQNNYNKGMEHADQYIALGTNHWDGNFYGCYDDVNVYNQALTDEQVYRLFDSRTEESVLDQEGIKATPSFSMLVGNTRTVKVDLPAGITAGNVKLSFASGDNNIASVDAATGVITAKGVGSTTITTTAQLGSVTKTAATAVEVKSAQSVDETVAVEYDLTQAVDGKLVDKSGHGNDADIVDPECVSFETDADGKTSMVFSGESKKGYIALPLSIMDSLTEQEQFTIEVKFAKASGCGKNAWLYCFGSKPKGTGTNYMFLSPHFDNRTLRAGIKDNTVEKLFGTSIQPKADEWYTVNMVFDKGKVKLYWNGVLIQGDNGNELDSGFSIMDDIVTPGTENGVLGYIGKSCWQGDDYYKGKVSSFKIYDKAMTDADVQLSDPAYQEAFQKSVEEALTIDTILGKNTSRDDVKYNLSLPATANEVAVTWESLSPTVIDNTGKVTCGEADQTAKIKGTAVSGALKATVEFEVIVKSMDKTALNDAVSKANSALENKYYTQASKDALSKLVDKAASAANQGEAETLVKNIEKAIRELQYMDGYVDPFAKIDESKLRALTLAPKSSSNALAKAIPDEVKDFVAVKYSSGNDSIASVDPATGKVTAKNKVGYAVITTTVTAVSDGFEMEYQTLVKVDLNIKGVSVKANAAALAKGGETAIKITYPADVKGASPKVSYKATGAVSVTSKGQVTGKKAGTGTVIVKVSAAGKSITRKVNVEVGEITGASSVKVKKSITLKVKGISGKAVWSLDSKGKKLATISKSGKFTARKAGKATVTAKVGKVTMKKTITIKK